MKGNRFQSMLNAVIGLIEVGLSLMQVWAIKHAIDIASGVVAGNIYIAVGIMATLIFLGFGQRIAEIWIRNILGIKAQNVMQRQLTERILHSQWQGIDELHSGDILNRLEIDVRAVVTFVTETLPSVVSTLALLIGAFSYLYLMDAWLAVITVVIVPIFALLSKLYIKQMRHYTSMVRTSDSNVQSSMQETLQHRLLVKSMETTDLMLQRLDLEQSKLRQSVKKRTKFTVFSSLMLNAGFALGYLVAFAWAALRMIDHTLTFGGMTAFLQLVARIQAPARDLTKLVPACANVFTSAERLMDLYYKKAEPQGEPIFMNGPCGIRLEHLTYYYNGSDTPILKNLDFDFKPSSCTAILGETGAGKTTLANIILAIIKPSSGRIIMYNKEHQYEVAPQLRCNIVYVPQGNTLLSGTIRENLMQGNPHATDEEMIEALRLSQADFVMKSPKALDTPCSEFGNGLSEGQAQRIAIARALLRGGSIMLLDEATSALDPDTENKLLQQILSDGRRTVIFITHRPAVVKYCSAVLKIQKINA